MERMHWKKGVRGKGRRLLEDVDGGVGVRIGARRRRPPTPRGLLRKGRKRGVREKRHAAKQAGRPWAEEEEAGKGVFTVPA